MSAKPAEPKSESLAARLRQLRQIRRAQVAGSENSARELVLVAFGLPVAIVLALTVIISITVAAAGGGFGGIGVSVGSAWLAIHQVPLTIAGVTLGALPLLPTLVLVVLAVKSVKPAIGERRNVYELGALFAAAVGGPLMITALAMAVVMDGQSVLPVQSPTPLAAFGCTVLVHGLATAIAVVGVHWRDWASARGLTSIRIDDLARACRLGAVAILSLLSVVGVIIVVMLIVRHSAVAELIAQANGVDGYLGLIVLSVLYLPNLAVAGAAALVGADVNVGLASLSLLDAHGGAVPPLPLMAVLPDGELGKTAAVGFMVTAAVGVYVGWRCRDRDLIRSLRSVAVAGAVAALIMVLATWASSGDLGELGTFGTSVPVAGVFTFAAIGVPGVLVALVNALTPASKAARAAESVDDVEYEYDDVEYDDAEYESVDGDEPSDSDEYNEYYVDDFDVDDFDPQDFAGPESAADEVDEEITAQIFDDSTSQSGRAARGRGLSRDDYEDVDYFEDETEVTGRRS
ncbi:DUF6350 family protein [Gordonia sp. CPCC 205333]|uniref:cell division protein PerM n=1 Tax=Gordonia sp. CPCC 205333 TaxID=3140790 RepID=UPI003AF402DB